MPTLPLLGLDDCFAITRNLTRAFSDGCNKPTSESGRAAMESDLKSIQQNCRPGAGGAEVWVKFPGNLKQVVASDDGSKVWGVSLHDAVSIKWCLSSHPHRHWT